MFLDHIKVTVPYRIPQFIFKFSSRKLSKEKFKMKLIYLISLITISTAAQLPSKNYLPSNQGSQSSQGGIQSQGSFQQSLHQSSQSSGILGGGGSGDTGNRRPQQEAEKNAQALKQEQEVNENGFHYSYETSNGIQAEESGNALQSQGGFSYKGDDGNTYTVTYTAGEGGFIPQGAHLPVAPPTPAEILAALQQNEKDEAAGIFDDGQYRPDTQGGPQNNGFSSSSGQGSGSGNHQSSFNANSGYKY